MFVKKNKLLLKLFKKFISLIISNSIIKMQTQFEIYQISSDETCVINKI